MLKSQNGITLVALVVTIIVLIILATITITIAVNGGLIAKTENARDFYQNVGDKFNESEANATAYIDGYLTNAQAQMGS